MEDQSYVATRSERIQNTKRWVLRLNLDGAQQPLHQRHECKRLHDEYVTRAQGDLSPSSSSTKLDRNNWTTKSWNSWHSSRSENSWNFLWVSDKIRLLGDRPLDNRRGEVWTEHPLKQHVHMRTVCHHSVAQRPNGSSLGVPKIVCHPRVMSRSLPHLTPTTSTCSLSPTSPIFTVVLSITLKLVVSRSIHTLRRFTAEWRILGNRISHNKRLFESTFQ